MNNGEFIDVWTLSYDIGFTTLHESQKMLLTYARGMPQPLVNELFYT